MFEDKMVSLNLVACLFLIRVGIFVTKIDSVLYFFVVRKECLLS